MAERVVFDLRNLSADELSTIEEALKLAATVYGEHLGQPAWLAQRAEDLYAQLPERQS